MSIDITNYARSEYNLYLQGRKTPGLGLLGSASPKKCSWRSQLGRSGLVRKVQNGYLVCDNISCNYKEPLPAQQEEKKGLLPLNTDIS